MPFGHLEKKYYGHNLLYIGQIPNHYLLLEEILQNFSILLRFKMALFGF